MVLVSKFTRIRRNTVTACVAAQPEAIAQAFHVREMDFTPGVILGFWVPHRW